MGLDINDKVSRAPIRRAGRVAAWIMSGALVALFALVIATAGESGVAQGATIPCGTLPGGTLPTGTPAGTLPTATPVACGASVTATNTPMDTATSTPTASVTNTPMATATNTPTVTNTPKPTNTALPASPSPTSALPTSTPGPTFTMVPTAATTATTVPANQATVQSEPLSTPPPNVENVDNSTGGKLESIPPASKSGDEAVAVIRPSLARAAIDPVILMPAPRKGEPPVAIRLQPVDVGAFTERLPNGAAGAKIIDFSVSDPTTGVLKKNHERPIEFVFPISDAELAAVGGDPSRIAVFRIDRDTGNLQRVSCVVDLPHRVARCQTFKTSFFVLSTLTSSSAVTYRNFITGLVKNNRAASDTVLSTGGVSAFVIRNDGNVPANVSARFIRSNGTAGTANPILYGVPANGTQLVYLPNVTQLADGAYSSIFESDQAVTILANTGASSNPVGSASTIAVSDADVGRQFFIAGVYHNYFGHRSVIVIQNADLVNVANVTITVNDRSGVSAATRTAAIPAGAAFSLTSSSLNLASGFMGSATVTGDQSLAVTYSVYTENGALAQRNAAPVGASTINVPGVYNNYYGNNSAIIVQNADTVAQNFSITYGNGQITEGSLPVGGAAVLYTPNQGLPNGFRGAATVSSVQAKKLAVVVNVANSSGDFDVYGGFGSGSATVNLPAVFNNYYGLKSAVIVENLGSSPSAVSIAYDGGPTRALGTIAARSSVITYLPNESGLANGFARGATVTSDGQPLAVLVNTSADAVPGTMQDNLLIFSGIPR